MEITSESNLKDFDAQLLRDINLFQNTKVIDALQRDNLYKVVDSNGATLLHFATADGNHCIMKHLIEMGADVNAEDQYGITPLMLTLTKHHYRAAKILFKAGANIYIPNFEGQSALWAVLHEDFEASRDILRLFIEKVKSDYASIDNVVQILSAVNCPLYSAIYWRDARVTRSRLEAGCSVDSVDSRNGRTALHVAVRLGNFTNVKMLLLHGADVSAEDFQGRRPLSHLNPQNDSDENLSILRLLLNRGAKLYKCDWNGRMQIFYILKYGVRSVVRALLQRNIRLMKKDDSDQTPLHYLACNVNKGVFDELRGKRFDANVSDDMGSTPLHVAASGGSSKNINFFLSNGAEINKVNCNAMSALFCATMSSSLKTLEIDRRKECIELLLRRGADVQLHHRSRIHTVFDIIEAFSNYELSKPILLHLAIQEKRGVSITKVVLDIIESKVYFKKHLNLYRRQLTEMQKLKVYGSVTLFKFIAESERKITLYARNRNIVKKLARIGKKYTANTYCKEYLRNRISKAIRIAQLKQQASIAVGNIVKLGRGCYDVVDQIAEYLNDKDVRNLLTVHKNRNLKRNSHFAQIV